MSRFARHPGNWYDGAMYGIQGRIVALERKVNDTIPEKLATLATKAELKEVENNLRNEIKEVSAKVEAVQAKVEAVQAKVEAVQAKIGAVQAKIGASTTKLIWGVLGSVVVMIVSLFVGISMLISSNQSANNAMMEQINRRFERIEQVLFVPAKSPLPASD